MRVLGIETSADDTGIALIEASGSFERDFMFTVVGNERITQSGHSTYGGIYPNLAKNEHRKNLPLAFERAADGQRADVIAVTVGPGIEPCLWTGITFAQELSQKWNAPVVAVNHLEGHIVMSLMDTKHPDQHSNVLQNVRMSGKVADFEFPILALLISGGNTQLVLSKEPLRYEVIGKTRDDAAGEAFDKVARLLGLPYPGGPEISRLAQEARDSPARRSLGAGGKLEAAFKLPRPMLHEDNFDFSFSGLKTAVRRLVEGKTLSDDERRSLAREFEDAVADVLTVKTLRAADEYEARTLVLGGGVSANKRIREKFLFWAKETGRTFLVCPPELSDDNALMIALAGYFHARKQDFTEPAKLVANGNLRLS